MDEKITSRENAKVKYACRLASSAAFRRTEGRFLAEGRKLCPELCRGAELETLFYTENALEKCPELAALPGEHYLVEDHVADKLADVGTHQGVFGVFRTPVHTLEEVRPGGRYLALERVQDPGNVGTLLRSAAAFGFDGVILSEGCAKVEELAQAPASTPPRPCAPPWAQRCASRSSRPVPCRRPSLCCGKKASPALRRRCTSPSPSARQRPGIPAVSAWLSAARGRA